MVSNLIEFTHQHERWLLYQYTIVLLFLYGPFGMMITLTDSIRNIEIKNGPCVSTKSFVSSSVVFVYGKPRVSITGHSFTYSMNYRPDYKSDLYIPQRVLPRTVVFYVF